MNSTIERCQKIDSMSLSLIRFYKKNVLVCSRRGTHGPQQGRQTDHAPGKVFRGLHGPRTSGWGLLREEKIWGLLSQEKIRWFVELLTGTRVPLGHGITRVMPMIHLFECWILIWIQHISTSLIGRHILPEDTYSFLPTKQRDSFLRVFRYDIFADLPIRRYWWLPICQYCGYFQISAISAIISTLIELGKEAKL